MGTIANVLTGVATLGIRQPNDARAEWSTEQHLTNTHSVKLFKSGSGAYGSTHVEFTPLAAGLALTLQDFENMAGGALEWGYMSFRQAVNAYWSQLEYRFVDPNDNENYVDVTVQIDVMALGGAAWLAQSLTDADLCGIYGDTTYDGSMGDFTLAAISTIVTKADTLFDLWVAATGGSTATWKLTRVRIELWESEPPITGRYEFIDAVYINSVPYYLTPGSTTVPGLALSSPFTDVGYTEDGVTLEYTADEADIEVEEETFPIDRVITKETAQITCNMAESSLFNINKAMAGSVLSGSILTLGAGVNKTMNLKIAGTNPAGFHREIFLPLATATGAVGMSYKKGTKTVVPVTFQALKPSGEPAVTIVDNAA